MKRKLDHKYESMNTESNRFESVYSKEVEAYKRMKEAEV
jgi:hypothetical protein